MAKTKHTHTGTCQACGRQQAVDNTVLHKIAKHGYTVNFGYFNGVCFGARGEMPAELDVELTKKTILGCMATAADHDSDAAGLKLGIIKPSHFQRWNPNKEVTKKGTW